MAGRRTSPSEEIATCARTAVWRRVLVPGLIAISMTLIAVSARVWAQHSTSITSDEAFSWAVVRDSIDELVDGFYWRELWAALRRVANDSHPPLSFVVQAAWMHFFGDSLIALRSFSIVCGLLTAFCAYMAVREALGGGTGGCPTRAFASSLAALLTAIHLGQIDVGCTACMYALGASLSTATGWLLLRALRPEDSGAIGRWTIYGIGTAAFAYTHNFAFFSIIAQGVFVAFWLITNVSACPRTVARHAFGFLLSGLLAFTLYSPWLPVVVGQIQRIEEGFWINPITWQECKRALIVWMLGDWIGGARDGYAWYAVLAVAAMWRVARRDSAAIFFLLQALTPWMCVVLISVFGSQSILQDRYMVFSQVALFCFWGVLLERLRVWQARVGLTVFLMVPATLVAASHLSRVPSERPPIERTVQHVLRDGLPGDVVLFSDVATLNRVRYYARHTRCELELRVSYPDHVTGQAAHISSLRATDVLWRGDAPPSVRRIWTIQEGMKELPAPWERLYREAIYDTKGYHAERFEIRLYSRK